MLPAGVPAAINTPITRIASCYWFSRCQRSAYRPQTHMAVALTPNRVSTSQPGASSSSASTLAKFPSPAIWAAIIARYSGRPRSSPTPSVGSAQNTSSNPPVAASSATNTGGTPAHNSHRSTNSSNATVTQRFNARCAVCTAARSICRTKPLSSSIRWPSLNSLLSCSISAFTLVQSSCPGDVMTAPCIPLFCFSNWSRCVIVLVTVRERPPCAGKNHPDGGTQQHLGDSLRLLKQQHHCGCEHQ